MSLNPDNLQDGADSPKLQSMPSMAPPARPSFLARCLNGIFERKTRVIIDFSRNVATMLEAGLPMDKILSRQLRQAKDKDLREAIGQLQEEIATGRSFAQAVTSQQEYFGRQFASVVVAAELSGHLVFALNKMADFMERGLQMRKKIYQAMAEPLFTILVLLFNAGLMLGLVLPAVTDAAKQALGESASSLLLASWLSHFGLPVIAVLMVILMAGLHFIFNTKAGQALIGRISVYVPVVSGMVQNLDAMYFVMSLLMGYVSGLSLPIAVEMAVESMTNEVLKEDAAILNERMASDMPLTQALEGMDWISAEVMDMIEVGEESGTLEQTLTMAMEFLTKEIDSNIAMLQSVIKPLMTIMAFLLFGTIFSVVIGTIGLTVSQSLNEVMRTVVPTGKH